jgi:P2-related tail formation protein
MEIAWLLPAQFNTPVGVTEIVKSTNLKGCPHTFGDVVYLNGNVFSDGLALAVIKTIQSAKASSRRSLHIQVALSLQYRYHI